MLETSVALLITIEHHGYLLLKVIMERIFMVCWDCFTSRLETLVSSHLCRIETLKLGESWKTRNKLVPLSIDTSLLKLVAATADL